MTATKSFVRFFGLTAGLALLATPAMAASSFATVNIDTVQAKSRAELAAEFPAFVQVDLDKLWFRIADAASMKR